MLLRVKWTFRISWCEGRGGGGHVEIACFKRDGCNDVMYERPRSNPCAPNTHTPEPYLLQGVVATPSPPVFARLWNSKSTHFRQSPKPPIHKSRNGT